MEFENFIGMEILNSFKNETEREEAISLQDDKSQQLDDFVSFAMSPAKFLVSNSSDRFSCLDYSVDSMVEIDRILEEASDYYDEMSEDQKKNVANAVGAYILEVTRRNFE